MITELNNTKEGRKEGREHVAGKQNKYEDS